MKVTIRLLSLLLACFAGGALCQEGLYGKVPDECACLCVIADNMNVREKACGNVAGNAQKGRCVRFTGKKDQCKLYGQGAPIDFFQVYMDKEMLWLAGAFLTVGDEQECLDNDNHDLPYPCQRPPRPPSPPFFPMSFGRPHKSHHHNKPQSYGGTTKSSGLPRGIYLPVGACLCIANAKRVQSSPTACGTPQTWFNRGACFFYVGPKRSCGGGEVFRLGASNGVYVSGEYLEEKMTGSCGQLPGVPGPDNSDNNTAPIIPDKPTTNHNKTRGLSSRYRLSKGACMCVVSKRAAAASIECGNAKAYLSRNSCFYYVGPTKTCAGGKVHRLGVSGGLYVSEKDLQPSSGKKCEQLPGIVDGNSKPPKESFRVPDRQLNEPANCDGLPETGLEESDVMTAVAAHNNVRREESETLVNLSWDNDLASLAQKTADTCTRDNSLGNDCNGNSYDQNTFKAGGYFESPPLEMDRIVEYWAEDEKNFDRETNKCKWGKSCLSWTQIVSETAEAVGCGYHRCPDNVLYVVCNYGKPSNKEQTETRHLGKCYSAVLEIMDQYGDDIPIGFYVPQCDDRGGYKPLQMHPSTGYRWCVDEDGYEIPGTRVRPGRPAPDCSRHLSKCESAVKDITDQYGDDIPFGLYVPQCDAEGNYEPMQTSGSTGYRWCVDEDGDEIPGTAVPPSLPDPDCGSYGDDGDDGDDGDEQSLVVGPNTPTPSPLVCSFLKQLDEDALAATFILFDIDQDEEVSVDEMHSFPFYKHLDQSLFQKVVNNFDQDGNGALDQPEFTEMLGEVCTINKD